MLHYSVAYFVIIIELDTCTAARWVETDHTVRAIKKVTVTGICTRV